MTIPFKVIGLSVLSLSLFASGCGDRKSKSSSRPASKASSSEVAATPSFLSTFKPMVTKDARFAFGLNLDKDQAFKVADAYVKLASELSVFDKEDVEDAKSTIAACKKDILTGCDPKAREFIEKSGLNDAKLRWAVLSVENLKIVDGDPQLDGLSLAIGGTVDLEKVISVGQKESKGEFSFEEVKLEGEKAWRFIPKDAHAIRDMKKAHVDPYVTSLGGRLVLVATSRDALAKQIRLYRKGAEKGDLLAGFSAANGEFMRICWAGIGNLVRQNTSKSDLKAINMFVPNGDALVYGLGNLTIDTKVRPDGMLSDSIRLGAASEADADNIRTLAKTGLMTATAQISRDSKTPDAVKKIIADVKVVGKDGVVEIQSSCLSVGLLAGAIFPAISSATRSANSAALSMNGRNLFMGIIMANTERENAGLVSVWPRTVAGEGTDKNDISGQVYKSATDYFNALFDMKNYGTSKWEPYVDKSLIDRLSGPGVPKMDGKRLESKNVAWIVAANVTEAMPDFIPVLISANFNPALLMRNWDGLKNRTKRLPIGPASGADKSMLDDKAIVVVRKGGSVETIKAENLTYGTLYRRQAFDLTKTENPLVYLTPTGAVEPVGHE